MATSINGYPVLNYTSKFLKTGRVPGTSKSVRLRADVLPAFLAILSEIDKTVINLDKGPLDGHVYRESRLVSRWSNHASGTAIDMRYDVLKADGRRHMSRAQVDQMHRLLSKYSVNGRKIFTWGGDYRKHVDEMHLEIAAGVSSSTVQALIKKLRINPDGTFRSNTVVPSKPSNIPVVKLADVQPGDKNNSVTIVQKALVKAGYMSSKAISGKFDSVTKTAYGRWQRHVGYRGKDADGTPGLNSLTLLGNKYGFRATK